MCTFSVGRQPGLKAPSSDASGIGAGTAITVLVLSVTTFLC